jgi:hypothetical protein
MRHATRLLPGLIAAACAVSLAMPAVAAAQTAEALAQVQAEHDRLVRVETELQAERDRSAGNLKDKDLILVGPEDGPIRALTRAEAEEHVGHLLDRARVLGTDRGLLDTLPPVEQAIARELLADDRLHDAMIDRLAEQSLRLRRREADAVQTIDRMLRDVRARIAALEPRRQALLAAAIAGSGAGPGEAGNGSGPDYADCLDETVPLDFLARTWTAGDDSGENFPVKGQVICRGLDGETYLLQHVTERRVTLYACPAASPQDCRPVEGEAYEFLEDLDLEGRRVLKLIGTLLPSEITFLPPS